MSTVLEIDKNQRALISVGFRILLTFYSIFLLVYKTTTLEWYYCIAVFILYWTFYILLYTKDKFLSILRLFNDYIFITLILWKLPDFDVYSWALLFAPILNCQNHSGEKRSILLYVIPIGILSFLLKAFNWTYAFPFLLFLIINSFERTRTKYFRFHEKLYAIIDSFFLDDSEVNKPYKIYEGAIALFNSNAIFPIRIKGIYCFVINKNRTNILNGSSFVWKFEISDLKEFIGELQNSEKESIFHFNKKISINNDTIENNLVISIHIEDSYYSFFLIPTKTNIYLKLSFPLLVDKLIEPFFFRLTKVLHTDYKQKQFRMSSLIEMEQKYIYVSNAVNSMHFIRNKLGPMKNYLAMVHDFESSTDPIKRAKIEPHLKKERQKLSSSLNEILDKASLILSKSDNPFNVSILKEYGTQQFFADIRRIWSYYFNEEYFDLNWDIHGMKPRTMVKYNNVGFELVLANWISNMNKYNSGVYGIVLNETEMNFEICFYNSFEKKSKREVENLVKAYNTSDKNEITKRSTHGLIEIKEFLTQMAIESNMSLEEDRILFKLYFIKYFTDEDTNI